MAFAALGRDPAPVPPLDSFRIAILPSILRGRLASQR
jgi:hypothetical protein